MPQSRPWLPHAPQPGQASSPRSPLRDTYHGISPGATYVAVLVCGGAYYGSTYYGSSLVVVVYRHGEHAGTLRLLSSVEARHVRVLERLLDVGHIVSGSIVNIAIVSRVGVPARRRAMLTMAVRTMPLLTMSLLDVRSLLGVEVHEPLHQVDRLGYTRLQPGAPQIQARHEGSDGCSYGCTSSGAPFIARFRSIFGLSAGSWQRGM